MGLKPEPLRRGDKIAIAAPAGIIAPAIVYEAAKVFRRQGLEPEIMPHALGRRVIYSGTAEERIADLRRALTDPDIRAIICARGGYGCVQLLEALDVLDLAADPKWLVGYSDVTALHALMARKGIVSVHGPMLRHLAEHDGNDIHSQALFNVLGGERHSIEWKASTLNREGKVTGKLVGGNLAVLSALFATPFNPLEPGCILFLEDVNEPVYKIERILWGMRLAGYFDTLGGLIVGAFTRCEPGAMGVEPYEAIASLSAGYRFPIAFNAPIGHQPDNTPLMVGHEAVLTVGSAVVSLSQS